MKQLQRLTAAFLASLFSVFSLALPARAEGFAFNWDQDSENTNAPHCASIFLLNLDTDTVAYTLNADEPRPMASMTKIMTFIVASETIPDIENAVITMPESVQSELEGTYSSEAVMYPGEQFTGLDLLYMMMVPSGNNAALTLAKYVDSLYASGQLTPKATQAPEASSQAEGSSQPGVSEPAGETGEEDKTGQENSGFDATDYTGKSYFVQLMNEKAAELGCTHTHFTNPHGLHNENHYTTAREMAAITKYAMTLPNFTEITGTTAWDYSPVNYPESVRTAFTTNKMLTNSVDEASGICYYHQYTTGIKTGSLDQAGYCITASATADGYTYIAVLMGSPMLNEDGSTNPVHGEMLDARSLFRWALVNLKKKTVATQGDVLSSVGLKYAWKKDELLLVAGQNASVMLPDSVDTNSIQVEADIPEAVEAPIRKGEQIGTAILSYAGETVATVPLVASESVAKSEVLQVWEQGQAVLTAPWFLVILAVIVALIIVYIILIFLYRRKQRQLRRVKRFRDM